MDESWKTDTFRAQVRNKFEETFKNYPPGARDIKALEDTVFSNSKSRDEYIKNAMKVLHCVKEKSVQQQRQQQPATMSVSQDMRPAIPTSAPDPMSALQSLACFPASDNQTTLIKTIPINNSMHDQSNMIGVTVTPANIAIAGGQGGHGVNQIQVTAQPMQQMSQIQMQQMNGNQGGIQIQAMGTNQAPQIQMTTISTGGPQMIHHQQQQPQHLQQHPHRIGLQQNRMQVNQMLVQPGQMPVRPGMIPMQRVRHAPPNMTIQAQMQPATDTQFYQTQPVVQHRPLQQQPVNPQLQRQQQQQQQPQPQPQQQQPPQIQHFQQSPQMSQGNMMVDQGPMPPVQQVHQMHQGPPSNQMHVTMTPTQSQFVPSPSQGFMPSPMSVGMMQGRGPGSIPSIPSPGQLNTPQMVQQNSPAHRPMMTDDQAYQEKLKQLQRFIGPLRARLDREEKDNKKDPIKIRNLLAIISDSTNRVPMEVLARCESCLEKMDFASNQQMPINQQQQQKFPGQLGPGSQMSSDQNIGQPLIDALLNNMKKPFFNHSLHRTFSRAVCSLSNGTQKNPIAIPRKVPYTVDEEIPHVIQGEVARLESKFKVQLHPNHHPGSTKIYLICRLDDEDLPCVPPISLKVPDNYPNEPPLVTIDDEEYNAAPFLMDIKQTFMDTISKLNSIYSMTTLLDCWAMSVRQACNNQHRLKPSEAA